MEFNLEQLRAFVAAVDHGSFSSAARHLGKAQSAISTAIANLECDFALTLFDRSTREPKLTVEGYALLPKIREILDQCHGLQGHANSIAGGQESTMTLAVEESALSDELDSIVERFGQKFPNIELQLLTPDRLEIIELVMSDKIDIGIIIAPLDSTVRYKIKPLGELLLIPVINALHPLTKIENLTLTELKKYRQLVLTSQAGELCLAEKFSHQLWHVQSVYWMVELIAKGAGWGWIPQHVAAPKLKDGSLKCISLNDVVASYHVPVDAIFSHTYQPGEAGVWLEQQLNTLITANKG